MKLIHVLTLYCLLKDIVISNSQSFQQNPVRIPASSKGCYLEAVADPSYYIIHIGPYAILRRCKIGFTYSTLYCDCIRIHVSSLSRTPRVAVYVIHKRLRENDDSVSCRPYFQFIFDRTALSADKSVPSLPTNIKYTPVQGTLGQTAATFYGDGIIKIWGMSYITFSSKFKFLIRFKLLDNYQYENKNYNLFGDGPCDNQIPKYSVTVNPVNQSIAGSFILRDKSNLSLSLTNTNFSDWVLLFIVGVQGQLRMFTDDMVKDMKYMGTSTIKSSSCGLEIGKDSKFASGFVGYVESIEFYNCFEK